MGRRRIRISAIVPLFNVAAYLPAFLQSLDAQEPGLYDVEYVFVDDGSTDGTLDVLRAWRGSTAAAPDVRIHVRRHAGVSAARNYGIEESRGEWLTFLDPDDVLGERYFAAVARFIHEHGPDVALIATNLHRVVDPSVRFRDVHPLRFRFAAGTRVVSMAAEPDFFVMNAASVFFPADPVRESENRFTVGLHASEDALFAASHVLRTGVDRIGVVSEATYGYRKRMTRDSAADAYRHDAGSYITRFEAGYRPLLEGAARAGGVPDWLQSMVLYEMQWLLPAQRNPAKFAAVLDAEQRLRAREAVSACLAFVSDDRLLRYDATALPLDARLVSLAMTGRPLWPWVAFYGVSLQTAGSAVLRGFQRPPTTDALVVADGRIDRPVSRRDRCPDYFGQEILSEIALRVPASATAVTSGGGVLPIHWARRGESLAQTMDHHRRQVAGQVRPVVMPEEDEVRLIKRPPGIERAAPSRRFASFLTLHWIRMRRTLLARSVLVGVVVRPAGQGCLVERLRVNTHREEIRRHPRLGRVGFLDAGGPSQSSTSRMISRARAHIWVVDVNVRPPRARARISGHRVLVHAGAVGAEQCLSIDGLAPDAVFVDSESTARTVREQCLVFEGDVMVLADTATETLLDHIAAWHDSTCARIPSQKE